MRNTLTCAVFGAVLIAICGPSAAQTSVRAAQVKRSDKNVLSGNESRLAAYNNVLSDCSSGQPIVYRVVSKPEKGTIRLEDIKIPVARDKDNPRAHCNGKEVNAVGLYYAAPKGFVGVEKVVLDVDWRNGNVERYQYTITVR